ncbi:Dynein heavy chain family protein [Tritrichomonas foetus]|uniref:Dynein heavy chain family protein n=1 Tax=Tritrichomonas foetus TaxID=1144522 RepID=A0A1J4J8P3_9EUKA|nr:Dynein heavy chain family protein [Tritrichomonas foetus]|eukprot:OHS94615.1 Dynein heavy chain family protein [Tritrichomonas foetus]
MSDQPEDTNPPTETPAPTSEETSTPQQEAGEPVENNNDTNASPEGNEQPPQQEDGSNGQNGEEQESTEKPKTSESKSKKKEAVEELNQQNELPAAVAWFNERITLPGYNKSMWTGIHDQTVFDFLTLPDSYRLFATFQNNQFTLSQIPPPTDSREVVYFLRKTQSKPDFSDLTNCIQWGQIHGRAVNTLLTSLEGFMMPLFVKSDYLHESIRSDLMPGMNKFLGFITETANSFYGQTVLYVPQEDLSDIAACAQNRALVQRLESIVIQWTSQLKTQVPCKFDAIGPLAEIEYWNFRNKTAMSLKQQIESSAVRQVKEVLKAVKSRYILDFETHYNKMKEESVMAQSIIRHLQVLIEPCNQLNNGEVNECQDLLRKILFAIRFIWERCPYYQDENHLSALLKKVSDLVMHFITSKINLKNVFSLDGDVSNGLEILTIAVTVGSSWNKTYEIAMRAVQAKDPEAWKFDHTELFANFDAFISRCGDLKEICQNTIQFTRKRGTEIVPIPIFPGSLGTAISSSLQEIQDSYIEVLKKLESVDCDVFDVSDNRWHNRFNEYCDSCANLESLLLNAIQTQFEAARTPTLALHLLEIFEALAVRDGVKHLVSNKCGELWKLFEQEVVAVRREFENLKTNPPLPPHQPIHAGTLIWAKSLLFRIQQPFEQIEAASSWLPPYAYKKEIIQSSKGIIQSIQDFIKGTFNDFHRNLLDKIRTTLNKPVLMKPSSTSLRCNMDPTLVVATEEATHFQRLDYEISKVAIELTQLRERNRQLSEAVLLVVRDYNTMYDCLKPEELQLFHDHFMTVEARIRDALTPKDVWSNPSVVNTFVNNNVKELHHLHLIIVGFKQTATDIVDVCKKISRVNILTVQPGKRIYTVSEFDEIQTKQREVALEQIKKGYELARDALINMFKKFNVNTNEVKEHWLNFLIDVDNQLMMSFKAAANKALTDIKRCITDDTSPLFIAQTDLINGECAITPSFADMKNTLTSLSTEAISISRDFQPLYWSLKDNIVVKSEEDDYLPDNDDQQPQVFEAEGRHFHTFFEMVEADSEIQSLTNEIESGINILEKPLNDHIQGWTKYYDIWGVDKPTALQQIADEAKCLADFESKISFYKGQSTAIQNTESQHTIAFVRLDSSPLQNALLTHCSDWQSRLIQLLNTVSHEQLLAFYQMFQEDSTKLQQVPTTIPELAALLKLMAEIKESIPHTEAKFVPLRENFEALQKYEFPIHPKDMDLLNSLSDRWREFKDATVLAEKQLDGHKDSFKKQHLAEVEEIRTLQSEMYNQFMLDEPWKASLGVEEARKLIDKYKEQVRALREREANLRPGCELFKLDPPVYKEISTVETDLGLLDQIWKLEEEWNMMWDNWRTCPFKNLEVASMESAALAQGKAVLSLGIKNWDIADILTKKIQTFKKTMPLITNLKEPAIKERHWTTLKSTLGTENFDPYSDNFTLNTIFEMKFNEYSDDIATIAMIAKKEWEVEQGLDEINGRWADLHFEITQHKSNSTNSNAVNYKAVNTDVIFETIEADQTNLSGMKATLSSMKATRYFIAFDQQPITKLEQNLTKVLELLDFLLTVQRQWIYLESIFNGSETIRKQIPNEASEFNKVNTKWREVMEYLRRDTTTAMRGAQETDILKKLHEMNEKLEEIQKVLEKYLEKKRMAFPRFYFLSNDDLLEIIGKQKDPKCVLPHLKKMFAAIDKLKFETVQNADGKNQIVATSMTSPEGEEVKLETQVPIKDDVERWLDAVEKEMRRTVNNQLNRCRIEVMKSNLQQKMSILNGDQFPGQCFITASQIKWTADCEKALDLAQKSTARITAQSHPLTQLIANQILYLGELTSLVRGEMQSLLRKKVKALLIIEDHARDVIQSMIQYGAQHNGQVSKDDFVWLMQLRFYWPKEHDYCTIQQTFAQFCYDNEYMGNNPRLVITPLTDRCYLTLTSALHFKCGGNPQGPAGTGKTETVKDLAKAFAKFCIVFNCSEGLDFKSMGNIFSGLAQTGCWSCFDEFNRIEVEVLSVVAQDVSRLLDAISAGADKVILEHNEMNLNPTCAIFVTMNPGYAGRSELPDNLKTLLRPVSMMVPNCALIVKIELMSEGISAGDSLARKIVTLYDLAKRQLSKQDHYDFGLRSIKSVLVQAGKIKRATPDQSDELILLRAMTDMNIAKFVAEDKPLFLSIMSDLFPGVELEQSAQNDLEKAIRDIIAEDGLQPETALIEKIIQLNDVMETRHGNMLVGRTGSGKTTNWKILSRAVTRCGRNVLTYLLNPKALSLNELYGAYDLNTRQWSEGILSSVIRDVSIMESEDLRWVVFDGPVDTLWIESMNSVLDDNKVLTLINSSRIALPPEVGLLFEVEDLAVASPATVSRCGMIYMDVSVLGYKPYLESWITKTLTVERHRNKIQSLIHKYMDAFIDFKHQQLHDLLPATDLNVVQSFCHLYETLATPENCVDPADEIHFDVMVEAWFWFCLVWSVGASLDDDSRKEADLWVREIESPFPPKDTIFDYYVDTQKHCMMCWEDKLPTTWKRPADLPFNKILVPTIDTLRNSFILQTAITGHKNILFVGHSGTGKTAFIENTFLNLDSQHSSLSISLSSRTSSNKIQQIIENAFEIRTKSTFFPIGGKKLVVCIDDFNMPQRDTFGSQPPLELLRQWIENESWYDREKCTLKHLKDMMIVGAMCPPGGGRQPISKRLQSKFILFAVSQPSDSQLKRIYNNLLGSHVAGFGEEVQQIVESLTNATLDLFQNVQKQFLPTPKKSHYIFNLRDMNRVYQGLLDSNKTYFDDRNSFIKLWCHECYRVFGDRLIDAEDRGLFDKLVQNQLNAQLSTTFTALFREAGEPTPHGAFVQEGLTMPYKEYPDFNELRKFLLEQLNDYNETGNRVPMNLVLFKEAIYHTCRIMRIVGRPFGHALLVGLGGSGRQSLTRLAAHILGYEFFQIQMKKNYREREFRDDMKKLIDMTAMEQKKTVFFFQDTQIITESFLEDVNSLLSSGQIPNLYEDDEIQQRREAMRAEAKKRGIIETPQSLFELFIQLSRENLHVVLAMSPAGDGLRNRVRMFPPLVNNTTINWFNEWPEDALLAVADNLMRDIEFEEYEESIQEETKTKFIKDFVDFHKIADKDCQKMMVQLKRPFQLTPTTFLEFVSNYCTLLNKKRKEIKDKSEIYRNGLNTLSSTRQDVEAMSLDLEKKKQEVAQSQAECDHMTEQMFHDQHQMNEQEKLVKLDTEQLAKDEKRILEKQQKAEVAYAQAKPVLDAADEALNKIKNNISQIHELSTYTSFHGAIGSIIEALMTLLNKPTGAAAAKAEMKDPSFCNKLQTFNKEEISKTTLKKLGKYMRMQDLNPEYAVNSSKAGAMLAEWINAIYKFALIYQEVHPLQEEVDRIQAEYAEKKREMQIKQDRLKQLRMELETLKRRREEVNAKREALQTQAQETEVRLDRANNLINGLAGERSRWEEAINEFDQLSKWLPGDCFLAAAFLCYCGPFPSDYRQSIVGKWKKILRTQKLQFNTNWTPTSFLEEAVDVQDWHINGLANDEYSEENATLVLNGERWPLCIDPQNQANKWIKLMYKDKLIVMTTKKENYISILENALQTGQQCLLQDIGEDIDPSLMPIMNREFVKQGTAKLFKLGPDRLVGLHPDFRLFITTKMTNPTWAPEVTSRATVVNFSVKEQGLEEQMLGIVVGKERPDLESEKIRLVTQMAQDKQTLHDTEIKILNLLASKKSSELLNDDALVGTLEDSKHLSANISEKLKSAAETEKKIDTAREGYRTVANRASSLFFVLSDLAYVDPMYQFSLDAYTTLFSHSLQRAQHSDDLSERNENIKNVHTLAVYNNTCRGLFEEHKLLFSFCLAVKIQKAGDQRSPGRVNPDEYLYLLRGPVGMNLENVEAGTKPEWLGDREWELIIGLGTLPSFEGIASSFEQYNDDWHDWYMEQEPETQPFPGEWTRKCSLMQSMIIVRCLRPDRVMSCVRSYVIQTLGQEFVIPPPLDLGLALRDSDAYTPLLFVLSPGVDPLIQLKQFAIQCNKQDEFHDLALGQGQADAAKQLIMDGSQKGWWVYLGNCHLMLSWMDQFEGIIEEISLTKINENFRLWLSSDPNPKFPISVLQKSVKMTTESPSGLRANMTALLTAIPPETFDKSANNYKSLVFALCFLHSVIIERRKFLTLGWNIPYPFNRSDFDICTRVIAKLIENPAKPISWEALRFLISDIHYGGRVTDDWDQRLLNVYVEKFFCPDLLNTQNYQLSTNTAYFVPDPMTLNEYIQFVNKMPPADPPDAFGQHPNADISSLIQESTSLLATVLSLQPATAGGAGASREDAVLQTAKDMLINLPQQIVIPHFGGASLNDPLQIVLYQEIARYNKLVELVRNSLDQLVLGIQGLVVMSRELDIIFQCLFEGTVPEMWKYAYPSLMPLGQWTKDLGKRVNFFRKWLEKGEPNCFWLGRFTYPTSFLTAVLQRSARGKQISIDQLEWQFTVMETTKPRELQQQGKIPAEGALIRGLYLEGARWSKKKGTLVNPKPLQLSCQMPVIHFLPVEKSKNKKTGVYTAPAYIYPVRGGTSEHPSLVLPVDLPTELPPEHWVQRGTALLLCTP